MVVDRVKYTKAWRKRNPEKAKQHNLNQRKSNPNTILYTKYGHLRQYWPELPLSLAVAEYNKLFEQQQGRCAICGRRHTEFPRQLDVDHNHISKQVRGLLCWSCNIGLGYFKSDVTHLLLMKAAEYIAAYDPNYLPLEAV